MNKKITLLLGAAIMALSAGAAEAVSSYSGYLNVDMGGEPLTYNGAATVTITDHGDGTCDFLLPDLTLAGLGSLGDISVPACSVETDTEGTSTYAGHVESLSLALYGNPIVAGVDIAGTITADGVVDVTVPVIWYMDNDCTNKSED
ncbi:MAG: calycin-like domain-containing protein, partial [bacterium]|nr:calycin-like domain-containing protein [bacterium]